MKKLMKRVRRREPAWSFGLTLFSFVFVFGTEACTPRQKRVTEGAFQQVEADTRSENRQSGDLETETNDKNGGEEALPAKNATETNVVGLEMPSALNDRSELILHRKGYTVSYNTKLLIPNWVAWHLTADRLSGPAKRKGQQFHEDEDVPEPRVTTYDYINSGYDRGHLCPAGDNKWNAEAMTESFLMTNICPQNPGLNKGDWNEMENQCRDWARRYGDIYIVAGPVLYRGKHKRIGQHKVTVPEAFFKVVLCMKGKPKAIGFIYKNTSGNRPKGDYVNSVDQVERITGIDFFPALNDKVEAEVEREQNLEEW
ncbi:MAG: DNA/RNA non-specific endonuclease [Prevotella sp.]